MKTKGVRPVIINDNIIKKLEEVANDKINAIVLTDEELVEKTNDLLDEKDKFSLSAWKDWKAFAIGTKTEEETSPSNMALYKRIGSVIKKALVEQKLNLFQKLQDDQTAWQRWAWIIERKFSDWNLKHISEAKVETDVKLTEIQIIKPDEDSIQTKS